MLSHDLAAKMNAIYFDEFLKKDDPVGIPHIPKGAQHPEEITSMGETVLWIVFVCMAVGAAIFAITARATSSRFRVLHINNFIICAAAAVAYLSMATGIGKTIVHSDPKNRSNYREIYYARYVDWTITTPLLLLDLTLLAGVPIIDTIILVVADVFMIITGLIGALHPSLKYRWPFFGISMAAFAYVILGLVGPARINAQARHPKVGTLFNQVSIALVILWSVYPIIWAFSEGTGQIAADTEVLGYAVLDVLAKPVWGLLLILATPEEGHVILPEYMTQPGGSAGGGSYGSVSQNDA